MKRPITSNEIELVILKTLKNKSPSRCPLASDYPEISRSHGLPCPQGHGVFGLLLSLVKKGMEKGVKSGFGVAFKQFLLQSVFQER